MGVLSVILHVIIFIISLPEIMLDTASRSCEVGRTRNLPAWTVTRISELGTRLTWRTFAWWWSCE